MKFSAVLLAAMVVSAAADAASIDMNDPLRAKGREDDVRIDAQLATDTLSTGAPIGVTWQIQNFTDAPVAVDTKHVDTTYDADTQTITVSIGSEVPHDGNMPEMVIVAPGEKKVFRVSGRAAVSPVKVRPGSNGSPRYVQVKVSILRDLDAFLPLLQTGRPQRLSDELFEQWFESTDTIFLSSVPVLWSARPVKGVDVEQRGVK